MLKSTSWAQMQMPPPPVQEELTPAQKAKKQAIGQQLQAWHAGVGQLPDLIDAQDGLNQVIGPPLTEEELQTVREALWKRQLDNIDVDEQRGLPVGKWWETTIFQHMAWRHLLNGGALRAGDYVALHGALLSALQPNTNELRLKWEPLMDCVGVATSPRCNEVGF